jgi:23S rRNA pseudouridine2605 synthase
MKPPPPPTGSVTRRHGVARVISKLGIGSRTQAAKWVREGRVQVNNRVVRDPEFPARQDLDRIEVGGERASAVQRRVVMLNKPRGLVTTTTDEKGRATVYRCFEGAKLPWLAPVGRLDKASEGLLLFSNDPVWAAGLTDSNAGVTKTYHVQIDRLPPPTLVATLEAGLTIDGEYLAAKSARTLRTGTKNAWLEIVLNEGRNRHIRRLLSAFEVTVLRLIRVALADLALGTLAKGRWRALTKDEIDGLDPAIHAQPRVSGTNNRLSPR